MAAVVTLTLNPAVDVSSAVARIVPAHKLRCRDVRHDPGGGGINVARVLRRLDAQTHAIFTSGGPMGELLQRLVLREDVPFTAIPIGGDTREDFMVFDESDRSQYRFVLPGPELSSAELEACLAAVARQAAPAGFVVASGSLPPGAPRDAYRRVTSMVPEGMRFVLDTSGEALAQALGPGVALIKPSRRELADLVGTPLSDRNACVIAARRLIELGRSEMVAVSLGEEGAILVGPGFGYDALAPSVATVSTTGAGDSFLAALIWSLARGEKPDQALRWAVAAGSAALMVPGTDLCHRADVQELMKRVDVRAI